MLTALDVPGIVLFAGTVTSLLLFLSGLAAPAWWLLPVVIAVDRGAGALGAARRPAR